MNKKLIGLTIVIGVLLAVIIGTSIATHKIQVNGAITEQKQILERLKLVNSYSTDGTTVIVYVSDLWLVPDDAERTKWCKTVGLEMDKIYSKHTNKPLGNVGLHVYRDNNDGTMSELARYKITGEVELYYKH